MKRIFLVLALSCLAFFAWADGHTVSQKSDGIDALWKDYPLLMEKFGDELSDQRADYVFALDVSGTMSQYKDIVVPALQEFFRSLQEGDHVSLIKFGGEAVNEVGSSGKVDGATVESLVDYAEHVYDKPTTQAEKARFFNNTDLALMLDYLATDLKQIGRSNLKFVFIITDFVHDPKAARKGKENWAETARRFATEQSGNDVYVFALQLPGSGRDLEKVRGVFPEDMSFNHVRITSNKALSAWFSQRKNAILLDKLYAVVDRNISPAGLSASPSLDIDGNLTLDVDWTPCRVYEILQVDTVIAQNNVFRFRSSLPEQIETAADVDAGKFIHRRNDLLDPKFVKLSDTLTVHASFAMPYNHELEKLGFTLPLLKAGGAVDRTVFCYPLPLWLCCVIIGLILLYIILVIRAFSRNNSAFYKINGRFDVVSEGISVDRKRTANARRSVDFGAGAEFYPVPGAAWKAEIRVKTYNPFFLFFKRPTYEFFLLKGAKFKLRGQTWGSHQHPLIGRYTSVSVGNGHTIKWLQ
ncbi:MAG: VWA domain-containing protein [Bacteroidales bacterium]|nr:VWA domain-containing protein [Bacteroidales bacterium]